MTTKSGHTIRQQYYWSDYHDLKRFMKIYKGYEYYDSGNILYIYEDGHLVYSYELTGDTRKFADNWAKYFINGLIKKAQY